MKTYIVEIDGQPLEVVRDTDGKFIIPDHLRGTGSALKPAFEPIVLARKPLSEGTVAANVLKWGVGALNIGACRVEASAADPNIRRNEVTVNTEARLYGGGIASQTRPRGPQNIAAGRWPANVVHDGSDEVVGAFPSPHSAGKARAEPGGGEYAGSEIANWGNMGKNRKGFRFGDSGSAARFFFNSKETDEQWLARNLPNAPANLADVCFNLSSELAASVLRNAAGLTTLKSAQKSDESAAPFTNVTPNELRLISETLIETIRSFERKSSLESLQERLSLSGSPANFAATKKPTGIITITISPSKSDGSAALVTYSIMPSNSEHGVKDCAPSTARFHYSAKASRADRNGSKHPTIKPIALMQWLARLITPPGGTVLDPFAGSGTTGAAAEREGFRCVLVEREAEYVADIRKRFGARQVDPLSRLLTWNAAVLSYRASLHV